MGLLKTRNNLLIFEKLICAVTLIIYLSLVYDYSIYFGDKNKFVINKILNSEALTRSFDLLSFWPQLVPMVFGLLIITCILTVFSYENIYLRFVRAISIFYLNQFLWTISDGGMNLLVLSHIYLCIFDFTFLKFDKRIINQILLWLLKGQFILIYITAFISKMNGPDWVSGDALNFIINVDKFKSLYLLNLFSNFPVLGSLMTRLIVLSQAMIPILLLFGKGVLRNIGIIIGVLLHLGIAIHMGLIGFSLVMITHYVLFAPAKFFEFFKGQIGMYRIFSIVTIAVSINYACMQLSNSLLQRTAIINISDSNNREDNKKLFNRPIEFASISKVFTLKLIDHLIKNKLIKLDDEIIFSANKFKLKDLIEFKAGIVDKQTSFSDVNSFKWENWQNYFSINHNFFGYSNFSYVLAQRLIEEKLKVKFHDLLFEFLNLNSNDIKLNNYANSIYNLNTISAFGLSGNISSLATLTDNLTKDGFCFHSVKFCLDGRKTKWGYYFQGTHGNNYLYIIYNNGNVYAMNSYNSEDIPEKYFN